MLSLNGRCPICDANITLPQGTEVSEVVNCQECNNRLVVHNKQGDMVYLQQAPEVEEDWGQ